MIFDKIINIKKEKKFLDVIEDSIIDEFENGTHGVSKHLIEVFFFRGTQAKRLQKRIAAMFLKMFRGSRVKKWYMLAEECRGSKYFLAYNMEGVLYKNRCSEFWKEYNFNGRPYYTLDFDKALLKRSAFKHLTDGEFNAVLCMGTFSYNGYFRENCLKELAKSDGYLRYYALRGNDWVREIRITAVNILKEKINNSSIWDIVKDIPMIDRLCGGQRRSGADAEEIKKTVCQRINAETDETVLLNITVMEMKVRTVFYKWIRENRLCSKELIKYIIKKEDTGSEKAKMLVYMLKEYGCTEEELNKYLNNKCANVRYTAVLQKYEKTNGLWKGAEKFLCDKAAKIRSFAVFLFKKYSDFEPRSFYLDKLKKTGDENALSELGTYGKKEDIPFISGFLNADKPTTVTKALRVLGKIGGTDGADEYWQFLHLKDISVCKVAYKNIADNKIQYRVEDIWAGYNKYSDKPNGKYFLYLLVKSPVWERMIYLLHLYVEINPELPCDYKLLDIINKGIYKRNTYAAVTTEKASELKTFIEQNKDRFRNKKLAEELLFDISHAGK